ncbi:MAG TPA: carbohydrate kinase [Candidatus Acidoferrum sp.]|nr:carbohydrate kinase [Candidatus Acidoferrum sp.]
MRKFTTIGLGELLWDILPDSRQLGGAPANFAYMTSLLGDEGVVASRVGSDELGFETRRRLERLGLSNSCIQTDQTYRTGVAQVQLDAKGQPAFQIAEPVAWDFLEWTSAWQALAQKADAVCFGSLAQRSPKSRQTIHSFLKAIRPQTTRIFDVNLRQSFYTAEILADSAKQADIIKLNHDELPTVIQLLGFPSQDEESAAQWLLHTFRVKLVCVTRGGEGSLLVSEHGKHEHPGIRVQVADTVGAGDAFTAALVYHFLRRGSLATMNEAANRMGSWVASQAGATPSRDEAWLQKIRSAEI